MYSEETKSSVLAKFLSVYDYVFVDTCSLMEDSFPIFMDSLKASREYWKDGLKIIVLGECIEELKKHARGKDNQDTRIEAKRALKILRHDRWHGKTLETTKSNTNGGFADNAIYSQVSSLRIQKKVLIITQDKKLATDLRKLNGLDSQRGRYVDIYRLNSNGELEQNPGEQFSSSTRNYEGHHHVQTSSQVKSEHSFTHSDRFVKGEERRHEEGNASLPTSSPIITQDIKLSADLSNPNYSPEKKIADIDAQLACLNALDHSTMEKLHLAYTVDELIAEKVKLSEVSSKPSLAKPLPIIHSGAPVTPSPKSELKVGDTIPQPKVNSEIVKKPVVSQPHVSSKEEPTSWHEFGKTVQDALIKVGVHYGWIFRDPSIAYVAAIHGPYDITEKDLDFVAKQCAGMTTGQVKDFSLKGLTAHIERTDLDFKAFLDVKPSEEKSVAPKAEKPQEETKPVVPVSPISSHESVEKKVTSQVSTKEKAKKSAPKAKTVTVPVASSQVKKPVYSAKLTSSKAKPISSPHATLIVGVPTDEGKKAYIERRSRREDNASFRIATKDGKTGTLVALSPVASHKNKTSSKKSAPFSKKVTPSKVSTKRKASHSSGYEAAFKEDSDLNAKLNNPNYPVASAIKDLTAQEARVRLLKSSEVKSLHFSLRAIQNRIRELKAKKK